MEDLLIFYGFICLYLLIGLLAQKWYRRKLFYISMKNGGLSETRETEKKLVRMFFLWPTMFPYQFFKIK